MSNTFKTFSQITRDTPEALAQAIRAMNFKAFRLEHIVSNNDGTHTAYFRAERIFKDGEIRNGNSRRVKKPSEPRSS